MNLLKSKQCWLHAHPSVHSALSYIKPIPAWREESKPSTQLKAGRVMAPGHEKVRRKIRVPGGAFETLVLRITTSCGTCMYFESIKVLYMQKYSRRGKYKVPCLWTRLYFRWTLAKGKISMCPRHCPGPPHYCSPLMERVSE